MKTLLLALMAASFAAQSPYELIQFENSDFRDWTFEEMSARLGVEQAGLDPHRCDGVSEYALLQPFLQEDLRGISLRVRLYPEKESAIYSEGELWSESGRRVRSAGAFAKATRDYLRVLERTPSGALLIQRIRHSPHAVTIDRGGPRFGPANDAGAVFRGLDMAQALQSLITLRKPDYPGVQFDRIGTGGVLFYDPTHALQSWESDGQRRAIRPEIVIAHEMYHAYDSIRGALDRRFVSGAEFEPLEVAEFRAVRFENQIREEMGLLYRSHYGAEPSGPGVLTRAGLPHRFPSPCLRAE